MGKIDKDRKKDKQSYTIVKVICSVTEREEIVMEKIIMKTNKEKESKTE